MELIGKVFAGLVLIAVFAAVLAYPTMWLWNWLMPEIFGLKAINGWQSLGLLALSGILIKSSK